MIMKVAAISFSSTSSINSDKIGAKTYINDPFLYTLNKNVRPKKDIDKTNYGFWALMGALAAVVLTIIDIKGTKKPPATIVDVADKALGLNKFRAHQRTIKDLKMKILYPLKATILGDTSFFVQKNLKSGLILTGKNSTTLNDILTGLIEHAENLGIRCKTMPKELKRTTGRFLILFE